MRTGAENLYRCVPAATPVAQEGVPPPGPQPAGPVLGDECKAVTQAGAHPCGLAWERATGADDDGRGGLPGEGAGPPTGLWGGDRQKASQATWAPALPALPGRAQLRGWRGRVCGVGASDLYVVAHRHRSG